MVYETAYFKQRGRLRKTYVEYTKEVLEPSGIEGVDGSARRLREVIEEQATIIANLEKRMARY